MSIARTVSRPLAAAAVILGLLVVAGCPVDVPPLTLGFPASVGEGQAPSIFITLPEVLEDDITVFIESSNPALLSAPPSAVVAAGERQVTVSGTAVENNYLDFDQALTLTISAPGHQDARATFQLLDNEARTLTVTLPGSIPEQGPSDVGEVSLQLGVLTRNGLDIVLTSDDTTALQVPGSVHIAPGATFADFDLFPQDDTEAGNKTITIEASHPLLLPGSEQIEVIDDDM